MSSKPDRRRARLRAFRLRGAAPAFQRAWMVNNGYTRAMALDTVASGAADLVAFGKPFIANPTSAAACAKARR